MDFPPPHPGSDPRRRLGSGVAATALAMVLCAAVAMLGAPPAAGAGAGERLLPDLVTLAPSQLSVETLPNRTRLRLGNTIANQGVGPLELYGTPDPGVDCDGNGQPTNDVTTFQRVFRDDNGNGYFDPDRATDTEADEVEVGCRVYHPAHFHWHFQDFATYRLKSPAGETVASSTKVSFCVLDGFNPFPGLPGVPEFGHYPAGSGFCDDVSDQGLSVGWADVYGAGLPGQHINVSDVPGGLYCLASIADPRNRLEELDDSNNARRLTIRLRPAKEVVERVHPGCD